jgi:N-methylhydantoinase A
VLYAFGGAAPQYAGRYAADLGVRQVVVPAFAPVFSAYGAATSDLRAGAELDAPAVFPPPTDWFSGALADLERRARAELSGAVEVQRYVALRFRRQVHQLEIAVPPGEPEFNALQAAFHAEYERTFGPGTAYADAGIELVGLRVEATSALPVVMPTRPDADLTGPIGERPASFRGATLTCPVYDGERTAAGVVVVGPAFVEQSTTTLVVYPGQRATIDAIGNVVLELEATS